MTDDTITVDFTVDMTKVQKAIDESMTLTDNNELFSILSEVEAIKATVNEAVLAVETLEKRVKDLVNARMKRDEGDMWEAVEGKGYKITRARTGSIYDFNAKLTEKEILKLPSDFVKTSYKPNSRKIEDYIKSHSTLPDGIVFNPSRSDKITIKLLEP